MEKDNGGPAFPVKQNAGGGPLIGSKGMTLRDYFAAKAMNAFVANANIMKTAVRADVDAVAKEAYRFADAMLIARGQ